MGKGKPGRRINVTLAPEVYDMVRQLTRTLKLRSLSEFCAGSVRLVIGAIHRPKQEPTPRVEDEIAEMFRDLAHYEEQPQDATQYKRKHNNGQA